MTLEEHEIGWEQLLGLPQGWLAVAWQRLLSPHLRMRDLLLATYPSAGARLTISRVRWAPIDGVVEYFVCPPASVRELDPSRLICWEVSVRLRGQRMDVELGMPAPALPWTVALASEVANGYGANLGTLPDAVWQVAEVSEVQAALDAAADVAVDFAEQHLEPIRTVLPLTIPAAGESWSEAMRWPPP